MAPKLKTHSGASKKTKNKLKRLAPTAVTQIEMGRANNNNYNLIAARTCIVLFIIFHLVQIALAERKYMLLNNGATL